MSDEKIYKEAQRAYLIQATQTRGLIIGHTITLERLIDECLAGYFFKNLKTRTNLIETLISSETLTFSGKVNLLMKLIKKIYNKDTHKEKFAGMGSQMEKIVTCRNKFAHLMMVMDLPIEDFEKCSICLLDYKDRKARDFYNDDKIQDIVLRISKYFKIIDEIRGEIAGMGNPLEVYSPE